MSEVPLFFWLVFKAHRLLYLGHAREGVSEGGEEGEAWLSWWMI